MSDKTAKGIIEQLMNKTPEMRLGGNYTALKSHQWFKDFNWVIIYNIVLDRS
jgi:cGMP-dependent protein kinase